MLSLNKLFVALYAKKVPEVEFELIVSVLLNTSGFVAPKYHEDDPAWVNVTAALNVFPPVPLSVAPPVFVTLTVPLNVEPLNLNMPEEPDTVTLNTVPLKVVIPAVFSINDAVAPVFDIVPEENVLAPVVVRLLP